MGPRSAPATSTLFSSMLTNAARNSAAEGKRRQSRRASAYLPALPCPGSICDHVFLVYGLYDWSPIRTLKVSGIGEWVTPLELFKLFRRKTNWSFQHVESHVFSARRSGERSLITEVAVIFGKATRGQKVARIDINFLTADGWRKVLNQFIHQGRCSGSWGAFLDQDGDRHKGAAVGICVNQVEHHGRPMIIDGLLARSMKMKLHQFEFLVSNGD